MKAAVEAKVADTLAAICAAHFHTTSRRNLRSFKAVIESVPARLVAVVELAGTAPRRKERTPMIGFRQWSVGTIPVNTSAV